MASPETAVWGASVRLMTVQLVKGFTIILSVSVFGVASSEVKYDLLPFLNNKELGYQKAKGAAAWNTVIRRRRSPTGHRWEAQVVLPSPVFILAKPIWDE